MLLFRLRRCHLEPPGIELHKFSPKVPFKPPLYGGLMAMPAAPSGWQRRGTRCPGAALELSFADTAVRKPPETVAFWSLTR
jgi:hypothetical protein